MHFLDRLDRKTADRLRALGRIPARMRERDMEDVYLFIMAAVVGLVMGLVSTAFRWMVLRSHAFFNPVDGGTHGFSIVSVIPQQLREAFVFLSPALGGLLIGLVIYRVLNLRGGHGVPSVMKAVATGQTALPPSMAIKSASSPITITSGGSAGPEGPIVEIGAVIGSAIGSKAGVRRDQVATLIGCGAASGIAAVFNAPLGGIVFALELIMRDLQVRKFAPVVLSAVLASVTSAALLPNNPTFLPLSENILKTIQPTLFLITQFAILGLLCGLVSMLLVATLYRIGDMFNALKAPLWIKPAIGGLGVGAIGLLYPEVMGDGAEFVNEKILHEGALPENIWPLVLTFIAVALLKIVATGLTLGSGGTGGVFAPALVVGGFLGAGVGAVFDKMLPTAAPEYHVFAMVGMAGVVSSSLGIPLAATILVFEIAGNEYALMLPLLVTVAVSSLTTAGMRKGSVYTVSLLRDGFDVERTRSARDPLLDIPVKDIMVSHYTTLRPQDNLGHILDVLGDTEDDAFIVINDDEELIGVISTGDLRSVVNLGEIGGAALIAEDMADTNAPVLYPESTAARALEIFTTGDTEGIPIIEGELSRRVIGVVYRSAVLHAYRRAASE